MRARRGRALGGMAALAFALGIAFGAGHSESPSSVPAAASPPADEDIPLVTDFDGPVPILMYHAIAELPVGAPYPELFVPPAELRDQVRALARAGFHGVTLSDVLSAWHRGAPIARRPVVLSFDDGLRSQHSEALPALQAAGWPGVLNLKVESLRQGELTDGMVRDMLDAGWELGSHTFTHTDVTRLSGADLKREIAGSRAWLEERFGVPVSTFCYPAGRHDASALAAVRSAGYLAATTTEPGLATSAEDMELRRIRVDAGDGAAGLMAKLEAAGAL